MPKLHGQFARRIYPAVQRLLLSDHFVLFLSLFYFLMLWLFIPAITGTRNLAKMHGTRRS